MSDVDMENYVDGLDADVKGGAPIIGSVDEQDKPEKKEKGDKNTVSNLDFDRASVGLSGSKYMDSVYMTLRKQEPNASIYDGSIAFKTPEDKIHHYDSLFWGGENGENITPSQILKADFPTSQAQPDTSSLGAFSLASVMSGRVYTPVEISAIDSAYKAQKGSFNADSIASKNYQLMLFSNWIKSNKDKDLSGLEGITSQSTRRDVQKKLLETMDSPESPFSKAEPIVRNKAKDYLRMQLKATQPKLDINTLDENQERQVARNLLQASLLFKTPPTQRDMAGYDFTKMDYTQLNPNNHQSAYLLRKELIGLSNEELQERLGGMLDGATPQEFKNSMKAANIVDLLEHTPEKDKAKVKGIISSSWDIFKKEVSHPFVRTAEVFQGSGTVEDFGANLVLSVPSMPLDMMTMFLDELAKRIGNVSPSAKTLAAADNSLGRISTRSISDNLAEKVIVNAYDKDPLKKIQRKYYTKLDHDNTEMIKVGKKVVVNGMVCTPLEMKAVSVEAALKSLSKAEKDVPYIISIENLDPKKPSIDIVADKQTTKEDIDKFVRTFNSGQEFDILSPLSGCQQDYQFKEEIKTDDRGYLTQESKDNLRAFVKDLDTEKEKTQEQHKESKTAEPAQQATDKSGSIFDRNKNNEEKINRIVDEAVSMPKSPSSNTGKSSVPQNLGNKLSHLSDKERG